MLRFPNPSSTIENFVATYNAAFTQLGDEIVTLDDIIAVVVEANLATAAGYMGSEAIARSTRNDRSRDPLYNQMKMYAELFRTLGWLHPTESKALNYTFTQLGHQINAAGPFYKPLLEETVLGIEYPSHILTTKGDYHLRPFVFLLRTMLACDGMLTRDEIIVGPLSTHSDRPADVIENMSNLIRKLRNGYVDIDELLHQKATERNVQINTLKNYTRWPIGIMRSLGWTEKVQHEFRKNEEPYGVDQLTQAGKSIANNLSTLDDIRLEQIDQLLYEEKAAISVHAYYRMLERAGFDISSVAQKLDSHKDFYARGLDKLGIEHSRPLLFSPFQSLSVSDIKKIFPHRKTRTPLSSRKNSENGSVVGRGSHEHLFVNTKLIQQESLDTVAKNTKLLKKELLDLYAQCGTIEAAADAFTQVHATDTQKTFYPLISQLFGLLGFRSKCSRVGVNYQRWDACVWLDDLPIPIELESPKKQSRRSGNNRRWDARVWLDDVAIPIEIKSPSEEQFLSTKAIRQALENKIVLLARNSLRTDRNLTTLIIGYKFPNQRGDMLQLIDDIYKTFNIRIGVIDFKTLATLALQAGNKNSTIAPAVLGTLLGFLHV